MISGPLLTFFAIGLYGFLHSLLASSLAKEKVAMWFGRYGERGYRLVYNILGGLFFLPILGLVAMQPGSILYRVTGPWLLVTSISQGAALVVVVLGLLQTGIWHFLGLRQLIHGERDGQEALIVKGLYRCVRHPLYSAALLFLWSTPLMTTSVLVMNLSLTLYISVGTFHEERRLVAEFGDAYQRYQEDVPRLIPCWGIWKRLPRPGTTKVV